MRAHIWIDRSLRNYNRTAEGSEKLTERLREYIEDVRRNIGYATYYLKAGERSDYVLVCADEPEVGSDMVDAINSDPIFHASITESPKPARQEPLDREYTSALFEV